MSYIDLILWCIAVYGCSNIIVYSTLLNPVRVIWTAFWKVFPFINTLVHLVYCIMCMGFWAGGLIGHYWQSPTGNFILDGFVGSAVCWWIFLFLAPRQEAHG